MIYKLILKTNQKNIDPSNTNWIPEPEQCNSAIFLRLGDVYLEFWSGLCQVYPPEVQVLCHQSQFIPEQPIQQPQDNFRLLPSQPISIQSRADNPDYANANIPENYGCQAGEDQRQFQGQILIGTIMWGNEVVKCGTFRFRQFVFSNTILKYRRTSNMYFGETLNNMLGFGVISNTWKFQFLSDVK